MTLAFMLLLFTNIAYANTDSYVFNVTNGNNTLDFNRYYNSEYVSKIDGVYVDCGDVVGNMWRYINFTALEDRDNARVQLGTFPKSSQMNSNYSDIRIYYTNKTPIDYYINGTGINAALEIKMNVTSGSNQIIMSYGNPFAKPLSNNSSVYLYNNNTGFRGSTVFYSRPYTNASVEATFGSNSSGIGPYVNFGESFVAGGFSSSGAYTATNFNTSSGSYRFMNTSGNFILNVSSNSMGYPSLRWTFGSNSGYINGTAAQASRFPYANLTTSGTGTYRNVTTYSVLVWNSTTISDIIYGTPTENQGGNQTPLSINVPEGIFDTVYATITEAGGRAYIDVVYEPHVLFWNCNKSQSYGQIKFSYCPVPRLQNLTYQVSTTPDFQEILIEGKSSESYINSSGYANIVVTDFEKLIGGTYFVRLLLPDNTVLETSTVEISEQAEIEIRFMDGITGEWIQVPSYMVSNNNQKYPPTVIGNNVSIDGVSYRNVSVWLNQSTAKITQGSSVQSGLIFSPDFENGTYYARYYAKNITFNEPITIEVLGYGSYFQNQTYVITPRPDSPGNGILELSVERKITSNVSNETHGIVHDSIGKAVPNATYTINNSTTGVFIGIYTVQNGGQYAYRNTVSTISNHYSFVASGYESVNGTIGVIKQDILMKAASNITIHVKDSDTMGDVRYFTTFFGDAQIIRSTDNGMVVYENVTEGTYQVIIQADGYPQTSRSINVTPSSSEFILYISKNGGEQTWNEANYVNFTILDQNGNFVIGANAEVRTLDGFVAFNKTLTGSASFVTKLNRTTNYQITVSKPSDGIQDTITIYGSSLSAYMYIYVGRSIQGEVNLLNGTYIGFDANNGTFTATARAMDTRITTLYFEKAEASYYVTSTGQNGSLGPPVISQVGNNTVVATWNLSGLNISGGATVTADVILKSTQTGNQEMSVRKTMLARGENGIVTLLASPSNQMKIDFGLTERQMTLISVLLMFVAALITASAGIPYLASLTPIVVYYIMWWAGWITLPEGVVTLFAIGLIVIGYDMVKRNRG